MHCAFIVAYLMIWGRFPVVFGAWLERLMLSCQNRSPCLISRTRLLIKTPLTIGYTWNSYLHTLHLAKCNNDQKIIKRRVKAICWALYNSKLELERNKFADYFSLFLKPYIGSHMGNTWRTKDVLYL